MKIIISSKLKGKGDRWFRSKPEYTGMTLDELLRAMKDAFDQRPSRVDCLRKVELGNGKRMNHSTIIITKNSFWVS